MRIRRILCLALAAVLALSLTPTAFALGTFSDVSDTVTAQNVEVLRLMGVVSGDNNGRFRPYDNLTRAEFCKMVVELLGKGNEVARYRSRTVFPDVRSSHWAAGYVNFSVSWPEDEKAAKLIHGMPDGTFQPDRTITYGEAVTILMRVLNFTDADSGAVWPQGYMELAAAGGVSKGLDLGGSAAITRAQTAQLFVNLLGSKLKGGAQTFAATLGSEGAETTLRSVDVSTGKLRTSDGKEYKMEHPAASSVLLGLKGKVLVKNDKALTFLPTTGTTGTPVANAAIIIKADGSTEGLDSLTGGAKDYAIYRNGKAVTRGALKRYDVATYDPESNAVLVGDTRVQVYYESCDPSPKAPVTIRALETTFQVLPSAQQSLSNFKPGDTMVLQLTADRRVAGAVETDSMAVANAYAYVSAAGKVSLICGGALLPLDCSVSDANGKLGRISQGKTGNSEPRVYVSTQSSSLRGTLDVTAGTLAGLKLSDNALILYDGELVALSELKEQSISPERISYVRESSNGEVDIVVIGSGAARNMIFGRLLVTQESTYNEESGAIEYRNASIGVDCGKNGMEGPHYMGRFVYSSVNHGDFVRAVYTGGTPPYPTLERLDKLENVPASAWVGKTAVVANGRTYTILPETICWNADNESWFKDLDAALDYGGKRTLYVYDGVVRVIEIKS